MPAAKQDKPSEVAHSKRATFDRMAKKKPVEREVPITLVGDDGEEEELSILFRAISAGDYDKLMAKYPPTAKQKMENSTYDIERFGPALIAACSVDPELSYDEAKAIWDDPSWSRGETMTLFGACVELNNKALNAPFFGSA